MTGQEGGCGCGKVRYRLNAEPISINCCHCHDCQRQSGSAFAINLLTEPGNVELLGLQPEAFELQTPSGAGVANMRCPQCRVSVWSVYHGAGDGVWFMRGGTLDNTSALEPTVHIFTDYKLPWVQIPSDAVDFGQFYSGKDIKGAFGVENAARFKAAMGR
ncbi:MAG: GFA family protein [Sphingomonadaceae bacterium]|nr:GFA family protein [Sphingomonadaceae bacterium]